MLNMFTVCYLTFRHLDRKYLTQCDLCFNELCYCARRHFNPYRGNAPMIKQLSLIQVINPNDIFPLIKGGGFDEEEEGNSSIWSSECDSVTTPSNDYIIDREYIGILWLR